MRFGWPPPVWSGGGVGGEGVELLVSSAQIATCYLNMQKMQSANMLAETALLKHSAALRTQNTRESQQMHYVNGNFIIFYCTIENEREEIIRLFQAEVSRYTSYTRQLQQFRKSSFLLKQHVVWKTSVHLFTEAIDTQSGAIEN